MDVRSGEAQQTEIRAEQKVLAAVVLNQPRTMIVSVVLQHEPRRRVKKVGSTDETTVAVAEIPLDLRVREPSLDQQPSEASLHGRFGRCSESSQRPKPASPRATAHRIRVSA